MSASTFKLYKLGNSLLAGMIGYMTMSNLILPDNWIFSFISCFAISAAAFSCCISANMYLKRYPIKWGNRNSNVRIKRLRPQTYYVVAGLILPIWISKFKENTILFPEECNSRVESGCALPFDTDRSTQKMSIRSDGMGDKVPLTTALILGGGFHWSTALAISGQSMGKVDFPNDSHMPAGMVLVIPNIAEQTKPTFGPYRLYLQGSRIILEGRLFDLETKELVGWLEGGEFGVQDDCKMMWNSDNSCIEIIDRFGHVAFKLESVNIQSTHHGLNGQALLFSGYFEKDGLYHIYTVNKYYKTRNINKARNYIKTIPLTFKHFGSNKQGVRLRNI